MEPSGGGERELNSQLAVGKRKRTGTSLRTESMRLIGARMRRERGGGLSARAHEKKTAKKEKQITLLRAQGRDTRKKWSSQWKSRYLSREIPIAGKRGRKIAPSLTYLLRGGGVGGGGGGGFSP